MAKARNYFGLRTGSTKSKTFSILNGWQIEKDRVYGGKNPRTNAQMTQRMVMATASAAYAAMREIANHSFEGVTYGQPSMSKFVSDNAKLLRQNLSAVTSQFAYNMYQDRGLVPGAYKLSQGNLPVPSFAYSLSSGDEQLSLVLNPASLPANWTANDFANAIGLSVGEMATICTIFGNAAATGFNFAFIRITFKKVGTTAITAANLADYFDIESSIGTPSVTVNAANLTLLFGNVDINDATACAKCVIYSRNSANGWLRSTAVFTIPAGMALTPDADTALATYPVGTDYVLNGGSI